MSAGANALAAHSGNGSTYGNSVVPLRVLAPSSQCSQSRIIRHGYQSHNDVEVRSPNGIGDHTDDTVDEDCPH